MKSVSSFLYRLPRFDINFPIEFVADTATVAGERRTPDTTPGRCLNLSHTGLLGSFSFPLGEGTRGTLSLKPGSRTFQLQAEVTHTEGFRSGLHFRFSSNQEQQIVRALVDAVSRQIAQTL